jgi:hypothetical protein
MERHEYVALLDELENSAPTPDLDTYRCAEAFDPNFLWRIDRGHVHNLLEAAMERIEELEAKP